MSSQFSYAQISMRRNIRHSVQTCLAVLSSPKCVSIKERLLHIPQKILTVRNKVVCTVLVELQQRLSPKHENIFYGECFTISKSERSVIFFLPFPQDKAPEVQPTAEEDISQEDWLSIKASLAQANERDELEKIKEDRVEYQEVLTVIQI